MPKLIMCSVHSHRGFREFVKQKGVDYIIEKPPDYTQITNILK